MKYYGLFFCVAVVFVLTSAGCQGNKRLLETNAVNPSHPNDGFEAGNKLLLETNAANGSRIPPDTLVLISETETLGQWFTLVVFADGEVVYTPTEYTGYNRQNLPPQGVPIRSRISREQLEEIVREFENQKFFSLNNSYNCGYNPDGAVRTISIEIGGRKKSVNWNGCEKDGKDFPAEFFAVFDKINKVGSRN